MFWFVFSLYPVMFDVDVFQDTENEDFLSISRAMEEIVDDPIDCYWLIKCFVNQFHTKFGDSVPHLVSVPYSLMEKGVELQWADFSLSATLIWDIFLCGFLWFSQRAWSIIWVRRNLSCWTIWKTSVPCPSCPTACGSDAVLQAVCLNLACRGPLSSTSCQHPVIQPQLLILSWQIFKVSYYRCPGQCFFFKFLQTKFQICAFDKSLFGF